MEIQEKITSGAYNSKIPYPDSPKKNPLLNKRVLDLSAEELLLLPQVKKEYEESKAAYDVAMKAYRESENNGLKCFRKDLETEYEMVDHPKANMLWIKAWEHGHSAGLREVLYWYEELLSLVK